MEDPNEDPRVSQELYFLIAKFLSGGPLKETAKTLIRELENAEVLPRRLDWEGREHTQSYEELLSQYEDLPPGRLVDVCKRALELARCQPKQIDVGDPSSAVVPVASTSNASTSNAPQPPTAEASPPGPSLRIEPRLSLLGDSLVTSPPKYSPYKQDHSLVRRLVTRELGMGHCSTGGSRGGEGLFSPRMLSAVQLQRRTLGHLSAVYCLVFECTGRYVITGADDLLVKVWSASDGRLVSTLRGAGAEITDVCVSADGELLAVGSVERTVRVWRLASGAPTAVLRQHQGTITAVHWSPLLAHGTTRWLASTSTDGSVAFWASDKDGSFTLSPVHFLERSRPGACHMICAAWSCGGGFLAAGSADHHVRVYLLREDMHPQRILEVAAHTDAVDSISWAHRQLRFVSGSKDGTAALWTLHAGQWRPHMLDAAGDQKLKVTMVCWDRSDQFVITAVSDCTLRVWCARSCTQTRCLRGHMDEVYVLEPHPFLPSVLLSAGHDGQLRLWDAARGESLAMFHNEIAGQGSGAMFDAKWGSGASVAASDSHGHLLLLGLGAGSKLFHDLPLELFFHTDYRPLVRDALGGALDEQTETPPHLMPPPFLVDVEGAPHPPRLQRLVPGREHLPLAALVPREPSQLDRLIAAMQRRGERDEEEEAEANRSVWRGAGVRHTGGAWGGGEGEGEGEPLPPAPFSDTRRRPDTEDANAQLHEYEMAWYTKEMRRRPIMICTEPGRKRKQRQPRPPRRPVQRILRVEEEPPPEESTPDTSDSSVRLSGSDSDTRSDITVKPSSSSSSSESQYSEWENGPTLAPPRRARRRPVASRRYSPSISTTTKRNAERASASASASTSTSTSAAAPAPTYELPEAYRPGEWITAVSPRKSPYHPQMGDECLYFRVGHQRYFEAVAEKDVYKVNARDKPWERTDIQECELVKVVGIKYIIMPPRLVCLKLSAARGKRFTVRYHDMADVIDFMTLRTHYEAGVARDWRPEDRFRCMIDDMWWTGTILERLEPPGQGGDGGWGGAARHFLSLRVSWDNGEVERLSPWDLEPVDNERLATTPGGAVPVLPHELEAALCREPADCPPDASRRIAELIDQVMTLSAAEPFVAPVDLQRYPSYAMCVPYPVDLCTIRSRFHHLFYRRMAAAQFDVRYLASNAETFNEPHSTIVRQARLITDLLLYMITNWRTVDVVSKYHELAHDYRSTDDDMTLAQVSKVSKSRSRGGAPAQESWQSSCSSILRQLSGRQDAAPFLEPVSQQQAPDYHSVISQAMDLGTIRTKLDNGEYKDAAKFAEDVRRVFANSRLYNTNKRTRIYSMTVRMSSLFEELWSRAALPLRPRRAKRKRARRHSERPTQALQNGHSEPSTSKMQAPSDSDSDLEPLAHHASRSLDSDGSAPTRKGKGVGKKSKQYTLVLPPAPDPPPEEEEEEEGEDEEVDVEERPNGFGSRSSSGSLSTSASVREELVEDEVELHYTDAPDAEEEEEGYLSRGRKRPRVSSTSSSEHSWKEAAQTNRVPIGRRERAAEASSSSSDSDAESVHSDTRRYESDRSYHPRYSSEDDAPLTTLRHRQENGAEEPGPSTQRRKKKKLRARRGAAGRYNEDSEDDSIAAISKRLRAAAQPRPAFRQHRQNHALASSSRISHMQNDHNYYSGARPHAAHGEGTSNQNATPPALISSRGRVRKLTAKARGLLRE